MARSFTNPPNHLSIVWDNRFSRLLMNQIDNEKILELILAICVRLLAFTIIYLYRIDFLQSFYVFQPNDVYESNLFTPGTDYKDLKHFIYWAPGWSLQLFCFSFLSADFSHSGQPDWQEVISLKSVVMTMKLESPWQDHLSDSGVKNVNGTDRHIAWRTHYGP